jgi:hypothetical protein
MRRRSSGRDQGGSPNEPGLVVPRCTDARMRWVRCTRFHRALNRGKDKLARYAKVQSQRVERLVVRTAGRVLFLDVAEIDWIEAGLLRLPARWKCDTHIAPNSPRT